MITTEPGITLKCRHKGRFKQGLLSKKFSWQRAGRDPGDWEAHKAAEQESGAGSEFCTETRQCKQKKKKSQNILNLDFVAKQCTTRGNRQYGNKWTNKEGFILELSGDWVWWAAGVLEWLQVPGPEVSTQLHKNKQGKQTQGRRHRPPHIYRQTQITFAFWTIRIMLCFFPGPSAPPGRNLNWGIMEHLSWTNCVTLLN